MAYKHKMYPDVLHSNIETSSSFASNAHSPLYPPIDMDDQESHKSRYPSAQPESEFVQDILIIIPGAILHLIDKQQSVELASGDLTLVGLRQDENVVAVLCCVGGNVQWPLAKDEASVKLDQSHYFFSIRTPGENEDEMTRNAGDDMLNYGLTVTSKGQENLLEELDRLLELYSSFSVQKVSEKELGSEVLDGSDISAKELELGAGKKELMEKRCSAYWTTLAPNVEDYGGTAAKLIASGSGHLIKGILWCGDVTVDRLNWGHDFFKRRLNPGSESEISPQTLKRIKRVKRMTMLSEKMATGILSGVVKVSGLFTSSVINSKVGKKFFSLLPGEVILASLDGFNKVCDAVEVSGRNVMSTSSTVTTGIVSHRCGDKAAHATSETLGAAGHAIGTAWAVFKIRKAVNPKSVIKPSTIVKTAASEAKKKSAKKKSSKKQLT